MASTRRTATRTDRDLEIAAEEEIARSAGLRYLPSDRPGWRRIRRGRGFSYVDQHDAPLSDRRRQRVEALVIPPAWKDVWIAAEGTAHLQATGYDADGRRQYLYHQEWRPAADAAKFARLGQLCLPLGRLRRRVDADLRGGADDRSCAALVRLIDDSLIRPGSLRHFRAKGSVGATTLQAEHLDVSRHVVHLQFEGKSAIDHDIEIRDPLLARTISKMLDAAEPGEPLFRDDSGAAIDTAQVNDYIRTHAGTNFTAKDLRTWGATCLVAQHLVKVRTLDPEAAVRLAIDEAADRLGNTATVCRASYVSPSVLEGFADGTLREAWRSARASRWLSRSERTVGRVLDGTSPDPKRS